MVACSFCKTGYVANVPVEHRRAVNSERYTTICLPSVYGEIRKTTKWRRIIVLHDNASSNTSAQTSLFLTGQNVELMGHPPYSPDLAPNDFFLFRTSWKKGVVNDFRRQKMLLKRSKTMTWKTNTNDCRSSKQFEYDYAEECQTFLWKFQISPYITRNMLGHKYVKI